MFSQNSDCRSYAVLPLNPSIVLGRVEILYYPCTSQRLVRCLFLAAFFPAVITYRTERVRPLLQQQSGAGYAAAAAAAGAAAGGTLTSQHHQVLIGLMYVGPVIMSLGCLALIFAFVVFCEARDHAIQFYLRTKLYSTSKHGPRHCRLPFHHRNVVDVIVDVARRRAQREARRLGLSLTAVESPRASRQMSGASLTGVQSPSRPRPSLLGVASPGSNPGGPCSSRPSLTGILTSSSPGPSVSGVVSPAFDPGAGGRPGHSLTAVESPRSPDDAAPGVERGDETVENQRQPTTLPVPRTTDWLLSNGTLLAESASSSHLSRIRPDTVQMNQQPQMKRFPEWLPSNGMLPRTGSTPVLAAVENVGVYRADLGQDRSADRLLGNGTLRELLPQRYAGVTSAGTTSEDDQLDDSVWNDHVGLMENWKNAGEVAPLMSPDNPSDDDTAPETEGSETGRPETAEPEIAEPEIFEPDTVEPKIAKPETDRQETAEPETNQPEIGNREPETTSRWCGEQSEVAAAAASTSSTSSSSAPLCDVIRVFMKQDDVTRSELKNEDTVSRTVDDQTSTAGTASTSSAVHSPVLDDLSSPNSNDERRGYPGSSAFEPVAFGDRSTAASDDRPSTGLSTGSHDEGDHSNRGSSVFETAALADSSRPVSGSNDQGNGNRSSGAFESPALDDRSSHVTGSSDEGGGYPSSRPVEIQVLEGRSSPSAGSDDKGDGYPGSRVFECPAVVDEGSQDDGRRAWTPGPLARTPSATSPATERVGGRWRQQRRDQETVGRRHAGMIHCPPPLPPPPTSSAITPAKLKHVTRPT